MSNATVLQTAANRFSRVAGFAPIAVDGVIGSRTVDAVGRSLDYVAVSGVDDGISETVSDQAGAWSVGSRTVTGLTAQAQAVGGFLSFVADQLKLPFIASPIVPVPTSPVPAPTGQLFPTSSGTAASLMDTWRALATWKKIAIGAFAGFLLIFLHGKYKKSRGLSGYYTLKKRRSGSVYEISRVR